MNTRFIAYLFTTGALLMGQPMSSLAQELGQGNGDGRWHFVAAPYLLLPYMDGGVTVRGSSIGVDAGPGDVFDKLQFGAMLYFEANNGTWGISLDGLYMDLEQSGEAVPLKAGMSQGALELTGYRRVADWAEILAGGRLNVLGASLIGEGGRIDSEADETWVDPFLGARLQVPDTGKWRLAIRGDVGGFGVGAESVWQVYPVVGYRLSNLLEAVAAYRWLDTDYSSGDGETEFRYAVATFGPEFGLSLHF